MSTLETRDFNDLRNAFALADKVLMKKHIADIYQYPIKIEQKPQHTTTEEGEDDKEASSDEMHTEITSIHSTEETSVAPTVEASEDAVKQEQVAPPIKEEPFVNSVINGIPVGENVRLYKIEKIVYDKNENIHDKLITVYSSVISQHKSALIILLKGGKDGVELYMGVALKELNSAGRVDPTTRHNIGESYKSVLLGNFPGTSAKLVQSSVAPGLINDCFNGVKTIASVSGIAALRNQNENKSEVFVQGMEKLIDSMRGKSYTAIYIADAVGTREIETLCAQYEDLYAALSPFKQSVHTMNENENETDTTSFVQGIVDTTNESVANAVTHGTSSSITKTHSGGGGVNAGLGINEVAHIGGSLDYHYSNGKTKGENESKTATQTTGTAKSLTSQNSVAKALAKGTGESLQITYDNRAVRTLLDRIDEQIKRLRSCEDFGMFNSCVYFLSSKYEDAVASANAYKSLIRGENSSVEASAINEWTNSEDIELLSVYLKRFYHPEFGMKVTLPDRRKEETSKESYLNVSPALMVSGKELAYQFSFPKKSVSGIPVISCAEFGRNVIATDGNSCGDLTIGKIYHMHHMEESNVTLSAKALTAHAFITGSTGSGKSNTVYQLIDQIRKNTYAKFLVVEPAKGEYKNVFGRMTDLNVSVYGTNPSISKLLRINPFSFPEEIHIYEHMDRLIEIFNVCWPMYAAMPAVLKDAIERAYVEAGWNLKTSQNRYDIKLYPTFADVLRQIDVVMEESQYSSESKGDYKGALSTRLKSLTNGINGMIFTADELSNEELFEENVIVDLSRVGSTETKSLIMGLLVMKLQEHRMAVGKMNEDLSHVTILEEAHNLLRRTSTEQSAESSNLVGKSVEMIANAIAEMRTYGEGFIIVDQAPGLLDMAAIRNTNTKIVLRLPEASDRELVGKACGLTEDQIDELARLEKGVAAVYQNDWIEAVLCKFERFDCNETPFTEKVHYKDCTEVVQNTLFDAIIHNNLHEKLEWLDRMMIATNLPAQLKCSIIEYQSKPKGDYLALSKIAYSFFNADSVLANIPKDTTNVRAYVEAKLTPAINSLQEHEISFLVEMLTQEHIRRHPESGAQLEMLCRREQRI